MNVRGFEWLTWRWLAFRFAVYLGIAVGGGALMVIGAAIYAALVV